LRISVLAKGFAPKIIAPYGVGEEDRGNFLLGFDFVGFKSH
jgi:hypothetical protein